MKFTYTTKGAYAEESQANPIRWCILKQDENGDFTNESAWLMCKDFFNDYVVAYNGGPRFNIYGFSTVGMAIPANGLPVFIAVKNLQKHFKENLDTLNLYLFEKKLPHVTMEDTGNGVSILLIDPFYLKCTYNISLLTLIIRCLNDGIEFKTWQDFLDCKRFNARDMPKIGKVIEKGVFFDLPESIAKFTWYSDQHHNSGVDVPVYQLSSLVHNGGCIAVTTRAL